MKAHRHQSSPIIIDHESGNKINKIMKVIESYNTKEKKYSTTDRTNETLITKHFRAKVLWIENKFDNSDWSFTKTNGGVKSGLTPSEPKTEPRLISHSDRRERSDSNSIPVAKTSEIIRRLYRKWFMNHAPAHMEIRHAWIATPHRGLKRLSWWERWPNLLTKSLRIWWKLSLPQTTTCFRHLIRHVWVILTLQWAILLSSAVTFMVPDEKYLLTNLPV